MVDLVDLVSKDEEEDLEEDTSIEEDLSMNKDDLAIELELMEEDSS